MKIDLIVLTTGHLAAELTAENGVERDYLKSVHRDNTLDELVGDNITIDLDNAIRACRIAKDFKVMRTPSPEPTPPEPTPPEPTPPNPAGD